MGGVSKLAATLLTMLLGVTSPAFGSPSQAAENAPVSTNSCGTGPAPAPGSIVTGTVSSGGLERTYRARVPMSYTHEKPVPVIFGFHGRGSTAETMEQVSGLSTLDAIAVYPQAERAPDGRTAWQGAPYSPAVDDVAFVDDLMNELNAKFCVDSQRMYSVGLSNGGGFSAMLGCRLSDRLSGYATVAGAFYPDAGSCTPSRPLPVFNLHGKADAVVRYDGNPAKGQPPVPQWMDKRAAVNKCAGQRPVDTPVEGVERDSWYGCAAAVQHYRILDGRHEWPRGFDAADAIWSFFESTNA